MTDTTPNDELRKLVEKWRNRASVDNVETPPQVVEGVCADELEALVEDS